MDLTIYKIYEIQNKGKGVITSLTPANLLSSLAEYDVPTLEEVLYVNPNLTDRYITRMTAVAGWEIRGQDAGSGYLYVDGNPDDIVYPISAIGIRDDSGSNEAEIRNAIEFYKEDILLRDIALNRGIVNAGDYEANFVARSLITKQYLESIINSSKQKIITYPANFTGTNYTLSASDHNKLIIVKNGATNVTITVPTGLAVEHFNAFIRQGTGEVAFTASGTTINSFDGLRINGTFQQVALDRELSTTTFYLTGNTKV